MANLHQGVAFSPQTVLSENIGAADTIIKVDDSSVFPAAPNYATIGTDELGETIEYAAKAEGLLSGCTRGVEGTAKSWQSGEIIARNFTAKDHNDLISSVTSAQTTATAAKEKADAALPATSTATAATKLATARTIQTNLASSQAESFNGTANVTPGVTGILPVAHGGTNATTAAQALANLGGLPLSGGTMTGPITGITVPTVNTGAANKLYVDSNIVRTNLLHNWYFRNSVNQRNITTWTSGYGIDMWKMQRNGTATISSDGLTLHATSAGEHLVQIMELYLSNYIRNKTVTMSVLTTEDLYSATFKVPASGHVDSYNVYINGWNIDIYGDTNLRLRFISPSASSPDITVIALKLEIGSTQTLAHKEGDTWVLNEIPDYGTELLKCQRYYWRTNDLLSGPNYKPSLFRVLKINGNAIRFIPFINFPTKMRVNPSLKVNGVAAGSTTEITMRNTNDNTVIKGTLQNPTVFSKADAGINWVAMSLTDGTVKTDGVYEAYIEAIADL